MRTGASRRQILLAGLGAVAGVGFGVAFRASVGGSPAIPLLRPPGAQPESDFLSSCVRCGQCVGACPTSVLRLAGASAGVGVGTPYLVPEEVPCNLCQGHDRPQCIEACPTNALQPVADLRDIRMGTAIIEADLCLAYHRVICRACWHACPFPNDAIEFDPMLRPVVNEAACVGCGLCTHACPTTPTSIPIRPRRNQ